MNIKKLVFLFLKMLVITIVIFFLMTIFTYQNKLAVDGFQTMGFPYKFYSNCGDCLPEFDKGFQLNYFILDIIIIFISVFLLRFIFNKKTMASSNGYKKQI